MKLGWKQKKMSNVSWGNQNHYQSTRPHRPRTTYETTMRRNIQSPFKISRNFCRIQNSIFFEICQKACCCNHAVFCALCCIVPIFWCCCCPCASFRLKTHGRDFLKQMDQVIKFFIYFQNRKNSNHNIHSTFLFLTFFIFFRIARNIGENTKGLKSATNPCLPVHVDFIHHTYTFMFERIWIWNVIVYVGFFYVCRVLLLWSGLMRVMSRYNLYCWRAKMLRRRTAGQRMGPRKMEE